MRRTISFRPFSDPSQQVRPHPAPSVVNTGLTLPIKFDSPANGIYQPFR
jgi:hypothetical protein